MSASDWHDCRVDFGVYLPLKPTQFNSEDRRNKNYAGEKTKEMKSLKLYFKL